MADIIHLKNGGAIYAEQTKQTGDRIEYQKGDDTYTIPKSVVESVEKGPSIQSAAPQVSASAIASQSQTTFTPTTNAVGEEQLLNQIVSGGRVNRSALNEIELRGDRPQTAIALYIAGKQEYQAEDYISARRDFEAALRNDSQNPTILNFYAALLIRIGNPQQAIFYAQRAVEQAPDSADAFAVLGYAQFAADHVREATQSWKKSLALRPDAFIKEMLSRAERESSAEGDFSERETGHFVLRYEGSQSSERLRSQIVATLESGYQDLSREFGSEPRASIQVVLYTGQAFFDVTRAPAWVGALNDGKIRIPLKGLDSVTPTLARILRHELAHSFVNQITLGRCPEWLNEGIAQVLEPRSLSYRGSGLAQLFKSGQEVPLNSLETGFASFSTTQAELAYGESLATVAYIRDHYGMSDVVRILEKLGRGESVESALRSTIHCDYGQLQEETGAALVKQFGG